MAENYKIKEAEVEITPGVKIRVELATIDEVKALLADLVRANVIKGDMDKPGPANRKPPLSGPDDPISLLETRAGLKSGTLLSADILAFKNDSPQLLRPGSFAAVTEATLVLLFSLETGLKMKSTTYDIFKLLFDEQNIKSGSPLPMLLSNLKNSNYIDKKAYSTDRTLTLTAKGEKKAIEVLKDLIG